MCNATNFGTLQASRMRISKTEYISCPSCGRTLFDLQETTAMIRQKTDHLKGIKIGIMGCIVNGPGEMADADYGYVGVGVGKISLYKGKEVVKTGSKDSLEPYKKLLEELKRSHGRMPVMEKHIYRMVSTLSKNDPRNAIKLLEWLSSSKGQQLFANINMEYPVNKDVLPHPLLQKWGSFKSSKINVRKAGELQALAIKLTQEISYE